MTFFRALPVEAFVQSNGESSNADVLIYDINSRIADGIQGGSGNQNLFLDVLNDFVESWKKLYY